jgi:hypothetical protein
LVEKKFNPCRIISHYYNNIFALQRAHIHNFCLILNTLDLVVLHGVAKGWRSVAEEECTTISLKALEEAVAAAGAN